MMLAKKIPPKTLLVLQIGLIFAWLTVLSPLSVTDTYYSVYLLCGLAALVCLWERFRNPEARPSGRRKWILGFSCLFSLAVTLANYELFEPLSVLEHLLDAVLCLLGGICVGYPILHWMNVRIPRQTRIPRREHPGRIFWGMFLAVGVINLVYLFCVRYPGVLTTDSATTLEQLMGDIPYDNMMPFWHTMTVKVFVELGLAVFGDMNAAVALFHAAQILFLAACFGFALMTLYQAGVPRWALGAVALLYGIQPYNIAYSVTLWKDIPFAGAALLFITALYRLVKQVGRPGKNYVPFVLGAAGLCLWRTNGLLAFAITALVMLAFLRKRRPKLLAVMLGVLAVCWVLMYPLLGLLGIGQTQPVEVLSVPLQQISRVIVNQRELTAYQSDVLGQILDLERVAQVYDPLTVDPIKYEALRFGGQDFLRSNLGECLSVYLQLGLRYPLDYLKAWIDETKGYWNGGYCYWIYTQGVYPNSYGLEAAYGTGFLASVYGAWFRYVEKLEILQPLTSIGLQVWAIVSCTLVNALKKRKEFLLGIPLIVLAVGLWIGTPVYAEFRYAYPFFLTAPFLIAVTVWEKRKNE